MLKKRASSATIHHQGNDKSGATLVAITSRMRNRSLAKQARDIFFSGQFKTASEAFPADTPENLLLSSIYLEGQRTKMAAEELTRLDEKLDVRALLLGVERPRIEMLSSMVKKASAPVELLDGRNIASAEELNQAGKAFSREKRSMSLAGPPDLRRQLRQGGVTLRHACSRRCGRLCFWHVRGAARCGKQHGTPQERGLLSLSMGRAGLPVHRESNHDD